MATGASSNPMHEMETKVTGNRREDEVAGAIEAQTFKIPTSGFLGLAVASMAASATLKAFRRDGLALFIGQWVPTLLIMGMYNRMVKQLGSDFESRESASRASAY